jgi:hypothetical protein
MKKVDPQLVSKEWIHDDLILHDVVQVDWMLQSVAGALGCALWLEVVCLDMV